MNVTWIRVRQNRGRVPAISLVETLVALAILAVLIAVLFPVASSVRRRADSARVLSAMRSHGAAFGLYLADWSGVYPYFTNPGADNHIEGVNGGIIPYVFYFEAHKSWHFVLAPRYYEVTAISEIFYPGSDDESRPTGCPLYTPVHYPCAFLAKPAFWRPETRSYDAQFSHTSAGEVRYPSAKTMLVFNPSTPHAGERAGRPGNPIFVTLCDGSARVTNPSDRRSGYPRGDGSDFIPDGAVHFADYPPLLHTLGGVEGRDIRHN